LIRRANATVIRRERANSWRHGSPPRDGLGIPGKWGARSTKGHTAPMIKRGWR
jgi:hypothetical protein